MDQGKRLRGRVTALLGRGSRSRERQEQSRRAVCGLLPPGGEMRQLSFGEQGASPKARGALCSNDSARLHLNIQAWGQGQEAWQPAWPLRVLPAPQDRGEANRKQVEVPEGRVRAGQARPAGSPGDSPLPTGSAC